MVQRPWLCILLTGVLLALSFPPFPFPFLAWVALIPLLLRWRHVGSSKMMWLEAFASFLVMTAGALSWPLLHIMPITAIISLSGIVLIPLLMAIPFALSVIIRRWYGVVPGLLSLIVFVLAFEHVMSRGPFAFPWLLLAHTHAEALAFNQFVDVTGAAGLSLWILLLNGLGMLFITAQSGRLRAVFAAGLVLLITLPPTYTLWRLPKLDQPQKTVTIGYVQPAVSPFQWADVQSTDRVDLLIDVSDSLLAHSSRRPEVVIWPETALPIMHNQVRHDQLYNRLETWASDNNVSLLTGAITLRHDHRRPFGHRDRHVEYNNSAILFSPGKEHLRYDKNYLVPFAEGVPFAEHLTILAKLAVPAGGVSGYIRGTSARPLSAGTTEIGTLICFESMFGHHARAMVNHGADFLVVLAQNGWWRDTHGYRQHFSFGKLRAIEMRRPVAHVNASAISAVVHPNGQVTDLAGWMDRVGTVADIPIATNTHTFYARHGDYIGRIAAYISIIVLIITWISFSYARRRYGKYGAYRYPADVRV